VGAYVKALGGGKKGSGLRGKKYEPLPDREGRVCSKGCAREIRLKVSFDTGDGRQLGLYKMREGRQEERAVGDSKEMGLSA